MTSILSGILSVIVTIAMTLGGVSELPSAPETASQITIGNLSVSVNGEETATQAALRLTGAVGTDECTGQLSLDLGGEELASIALKLTADRISAALAGSDNVYTVSEENLEALLGTDMETVTAQLSDESVSSAAALTGSILADAEAVVEYVKDPVNAADMRRQVNDVLFKDAQTQDVTATVDGAEVSAVQYNADITMDTVYNLYDWMENCGIEPIQNYMKDLLGIFSTAMQQEFTSIRQVLDTAVTEDVSFTLPVECVVAETDDAQYTKIVYTGDLEDIVLNVTLEQTNRNDGGSDFTMNASANTADGDSALNELVMNGSIGMTDGKLSAMSLTADFSQHQHYTVTYSYDDDDEAEAAADETETAETEAVETEEPAATGFDYASDITANAQYSAVKGDCGWDISADASLTSSYTQQELGTGADPISGSQTMQASGSVVNTKEADGSNTAAVSFGYGMDMGLGEESKSDMNVSFTVNTAEVPYTDLTADKANTVELSADMEDMPEGFENDLMTLMNAVTALSQDEGFAKLTELFAGSDSEYDDTAYEDASNEDAYSDESVDNDLVLLDSMTDWSELASYLTGESPAVILPENCTFDCGYAYTDGSTIGAEILDENGDLLYDVTVSDYGEDMSQYIMDDAAVETIEDRTVEFGMDGDNVIYAEVYAGNDIVNIYFYTPTDRAAAVQVVTDLL